MSPSYGCSEIYVEGFMASDTLPKIQHSHDSIEKEDVKRGDENVGEAG